MVCMDNLMNSWELETRNSKLETRKKSTKDNPVSGYTSMPTYTSLEN